MNEELKPCPFCGGESGFQQTPDKYLFVACRICSTSTAGFSENEDHRYQRLAMIWNARAIDKRIAALELQLKNIDDDQKRLVSRFSSRTAELEKEIYETKAELYQAKVDRNHWQSKYDEEDVDVKNESDSLNIIDDRDEAELDAVKGERDEACLDAKSAEAEISIVKKQCDAALSALAEKDKEIKRLRNALQPFALVVEKDIGNDEADEDRFRPASKYNRAPIITVGDLRRAYVALNPEKSDV